MTTDLRDQIDAANARADCRLLAGLPGRRIEEAGPCPKCGGEDRFHARASWWFCRRCHDKRGDAVAMMRWLHGYDLREALDCLGGTLPAGPAPQRAAVTAHKDGDAFDAARWKGRVSEAEKRLHGSQGAAGRAYLEGRGLCDPSLWRAYGLGLHDVHVPGSDPATYRPAVSLPWRCADGSLGAVRSRFVDADVTPKVASAPGRMLAEAFGLPQLPQTPAIRSQRDFVVVEGELNLLSIAAVGTGGGGHLRCDAVSVGSESARLGPYLLAAARDYRRVYVWADKDKRAEVWMVQAKDAGIEAVPLQSPEGKDANDLLRLGLLPAFLCYWRYQAARDENERAGVKWDLLDVVQGRPPNEDEAGLLAEWGAAGLLA